MPTFKPCDDDNRWLCRSTMQEQGTMIPYAKHHICEDDIQAVVDVLRSAWITSGPKLKEFEDRFAATIGAKYAVAFSSGTAALHTAMRVGGIGAGDWVLTVPNSFLASANCAAMVGANVDFVDIDPVTHNLDPDQLAKHWRPGTKAVIAVDYAGQPCDMRAIHRVAHSEGAIVIEDGCHALGSAFVDDGRLWQVGSHPWADMTVFSFHPAKTITTGEGGMLVTNNRDWAERARSLRSHGVVRNGDCDFVGLGTDDHPSLAERGPWYYEMQQLGVNYRLTEMQCALGLSQLRRLTQFVEARRNLVKMYNSSLLAVPGLTIPVVGMPANEQHIAWHLYTVEIDYKRIGKSRTAVMQELAANGIGTQVLYIPIHLQPWYRQKFGYGVGKCPVAEEFYRRALSLPLYSSLSEAELYQVVLEL